MSIKRKSLNRHGELFKGSSFCVTFSEEALRPVVAPFASRGANPKLPCMWWGGDCPFHVELFVLFVLLYILCYKSFPKLLLAHVTLGHLNNCFSVRLISGYDLVTVLNLPHWKNPTGNLESKPFPWQSWGHEGRWR